MSLIPYLLSCGIVGAGMVALVKIGPCPCPWLKLLFAFVGGAIGGWLFKIVSNVKMIGSVDFLAGCLPAIALATLFYCILCPIMSPRP